ncbi:MAG TPA: N-acetylmuramoyl-L-alanine amidase, partial [Bacteroides graminisolvens]|nr:N-acetylmuramoyl-L-alanine amidase [Bacteroides graminisolvens]
MKQVYKYILLFCIGLWLPWLPDCSTAWAKDFVVIIDPGHGGHDPGAVGRISKEKNINL